MTEPALIEIIDLAKQYQGLRPLRVAGLRVGRADRYALSGFDAGAAEALVLLITGAALPDSGEIHVLGRNTREIATDTEWLLSLDRFGIVTKRAVLIDALPIAANMALPITLSIEPIPAEVRRRVEHLAGETGLPIARLAAAAGTLSAEERVRVHLARALASDPAVLLLEHPTADVDPAAAEALGVTLRQVSESRGVAFIALTEDERFARASGGTRLRLQPATGVLVKETFWRRWH